MINFIKNDFRKVREALNYLVNRKVPFGIFLIYYIVVGLIALPIAPLILIWYKITIYRMVKQSNKEA